MTSGIINVGVSVVLENYALRAKPTDKSVICKQTMNLSVGCATFQYEL